VVPAWGSLAIPTSSYVARIDSTRPYILLPRTTCDQLTSALGIAWDAPSGHYLIGKDANDRLKTQNVTLEFLLGSQSTPQSQITANSTLTTKISIPYSALALNLSYPYLAPGNTSLYLPIMPTDDTNQYILGRAFLQQAYLIANYERKAFTLNPINWTKIATKKVPDVYSIPTNSSKITPSYLLDGQISRGSARKLNTAALIAGIVVGVVLLIIAIFGFFCFRRRKAKKEQLAQEEREAQMKLDTNIRSATGSSDSDLAALASATSIQSEEEKLHEADGTPIEIVELENKPILEMPDTGGIMSVHYKDTELDAGPQEQIFEMEGTPVTAGVQVYEKGRLVQVVGPITKTPTPPQAQNDGLRVPIRNDAPASPIPKTPAEYYGRKGPRKFGFSKDDLKRYQGMDSVIASSSSDDRPPASAIPQTPVEYYGRNIPVYRLPKQPLATIGKIDEKDSESTVSSLDSGGASTGSGLRIPTFGVAGRKGVSPPESPKLPPASPIPQTPLEFYGKLPVTVGSAEKRKWVGRAPEVPLMVLIPATPVDGIAPPIPLRSAAREKRPPGAWDTDSESDKSSAKSSPKIPESFHSARDSPKIPESAAESQKDSPKIPESVKSTKGLLVIPESVESTSTSQNIPQLVVHSANDSPKTFEPAAIEKDINTQFDSGNSAPGSPMHSDSGKKSAEEPLMHSELDQNVRNKKATVSPGNSDSGKESRDSSKKPYSDEGAKDKRPKDSPKNPDSGKSPD
jgi:hypothetical protein